jgi:tetratricopeptide (TPR) repeat protein
VLDVEEPVEVERLIDLEPTADETADAGVEAEPLADLEPVALDALGDEARPSDLPDDEHSGPLSESDFAHIPLEEVPRATPARAHDLSLPGELPVTPDQSRTVGFTPTSVAAGDDARAAAEEEADLLADLAARDVEHRTWPPHPAYVAPAPPSGAANPPPDEDVPNPFAAVDDSAPNAGRPDTDADFLSQPPSFGAPDASGEFAFPPLPGLHPAGSSTPTGRNAWRSTPDPAPEPLPDESSDGTPASQPVPERGAHSPRSTLSIGGAEDHLRQRLELEPENWHLRRMLGEAMLDTGNRDGGLYELELAMTGLELDGDIDRAAEVVDEILGLSSGSVRHHQKRVEYAVRARDRQRLIYAYLELADALFRSGTADKAVSVYTRVLELDDTNDRAEFALATLAPDELARVRGGPLRPERWSDELAAIPDPAVSTTALAVEEEQAEAEQVAGVDSLAMEEEPAETVDAADVGSLAQGSYEAPAGTDPTGDSGPELDTWDLPAEEPMLSGGQAAASPEEEGVPDEDREAGEAGDELELHAMAADEAWPEPREEAIDAPGEPPRAGTQVEGAVREQWPAEETAEPARDDAMVLEEPVAVNEEAPDDPGVAAAGDGEPIHAGADIDGTAPPEPESSTASRLDRARGLTPAIASDSDFVDLGDWLRATEPTRSTRMQVEDPQPTGDEQADFEELLRRFKRGVAENVEAEDYEAHYDLGVAYKEMGLTDEAIAQFQKALRGENHRVRAYEALGQCFVEKEQYPIAAALLRRATELPGTDDQQLVGVLYLLGFATEHLGRPGEALSYYLRVFAVDIEFRDVAARVADMGNPTT